MSPSTKAQNSATTRAPRTRHVPLTGITPGDSESRRSLARVTRVSGGAATRGTTFNSSL